MRFSKALTLEIHNSFLLVGQDINSYNIRNMPVIIHLYNYLINFKAKFEFHTNTFHHNVSAIFEGAGKNVLTIKE